MKHSFNVSVSVDEQTGELIAVYFLIRKGKSAETREVGNGTALADYDSKGQLLGVELLAPCRLSVLTNIEGAEPETKKFMQRAAPREMVMT